MGSQANDYGKLHHRQPPYLDHFVLQHNGSTPPLSPLQRLLKTASSGSLRSKATSMYYDNFWKCPGCGQIYWQGTHWKRIEKTLDQAQSMLG